MSTRRVPDGQLSLLAGCLDERDRAVLAFGRDHHLQGRVRDRVQAQLGVHETRYYQLLSALLDRPEAADAEPELIEQLRTLRRHRQQRRGRRAAG